MELKDLEQQDREYLIKLRKNYRLQLEYLKRELEKLDKRLKKHD